MTNLEKIKKEFNNYISSLEAEEAELFLCVIQELDLKAGKIATDAFKRFDNEVLGNYTDEEIDELFKAGEYTKKFKEWLLKIC